VVVGGWIVFYLMFIIFFFFVFCVGEEVL